MATQASAPSATTTSAVKVISKTWARDSHDLFDFEAHQLHTQTFSVPKSTVCMRNGTEVQMVGERDVPPMGGDPLLRLVQRDGTFWVDKAQPSSNSKKLWLVVRDLVSSSHRLQEGDVIKLGRFKFRVRQLVATSYGGMQPELRHGPRTTQSRWASTWAAPHTVFGSRLRGPKQLPVGLRYWPNFITKGEEAELLQAVDGPGAAWLRKIRRAQQFFGLVYYQTSQSVPELQPTAQSSAKQQRGRDLEELPHWLMPRLRSSGLFSAPGQGINQVQANEYLEDSGIGAHVEDPAAGETLATLSLLRPVQLTLQRAEAGRPVHRDKRDPEDCIKVLLEPRSLFVLEGESRHDFTHAIRQSRRVPLRDGRVVIRDDHFRRVSLTFRGIVEEKRSSTRSDMPAGYETYVVPAELDDSGVICCAVEPGPDGEGPQVNKLLCRICLLEGPGEDDPLIAPCQCKGSIEYVHLGCLRHWIRGRLNLSDRPLGSYFYRPLTCELCKSVYPTYIHTNSGQDRSPLVEVPFTQPPFIVLENMVRDSQQHTSRGLHVISLAEKELKLGRGHESDVRIADVSISRTHATIRFSKGQFLLQDSSSKFGTLVAMKKPRVLEPGVNISIQMGRTVLTLCAQHDPNHSNSASSLNQLPMGGSAQDERALRLSLLTRGQSEGGQSGGQTAQSEELPEE
ncbi:ALKBH8 [Symbiodinium natans]|uniref:ALKBH8 protein n=1 Tax=Symbiodinium natans TaxID=878477 RepID=A0A812PND4_9DINO|nr:ALKBH8 [Symbiodinium natans]